jgi:NADH-quinone oxidoreductase subunit N
VSANYIPLPAEFFRILPELILTAAGTLIMIVEATIRSAKLSSRICLAALLAALWGAVVANSNPGPAFNALLIGGFASFFRVLLIVIALLIYFLSLDYLERERAERSEFYALLLFSVVGQCLMVAANDLIVIFIGLEISSIASYVMAGYLRSDPRNSESALKYFLLGSFATAFLLYGIAWIYGLTESTNLTEIRRILSTREVAPNVALVGTAAALIFVGVAFKISAAPFQIWAPDVYQGAPAPVSAYLSTGPKAAAFAVMLRVFIGAFEPAAAKWLPIVWMAAVLSMIVGNFAALVQTNLKRLLAYSSIAHAGYVLVAVTANDGAGTAAAMFYVAAYAFMQIGAFAVVTHIAGKGEQHLDIDDLAGLAERQPVTAALLAVFLLSLIGVPLTAGFFAKFYVFKAAIGAHLTRLAIIGLLNSAVAAYYYLRLLVVVYMHEPGPAVESLQPPPRGLQAALWISAASTLALGIAPSLVSGFAGDSALLGK